MKNVINNTQKQPKPSSVYFAVPAIADYNHEDSKAFLFKVSKM